MSDYELFTTCGSAGLDGGRHPAGGAVCQPRPTSLANHVTYSASIDGWRPRNSEANWTLEVFSQVFGGNDFSARLTAPRTLIVQCHDGYFSDSTVSDLLAALRVTSLI